MAPGLSQGGDRRGGLRILQAVTGLLGLRTAPSLSHPSPYVVYLGVIAVAVAFLGTLTYFGAREFSGRAVNSRAADEARSLADHSASLATGDAFDGYLQILRYAEDPAVRDRGVPADERIAALSQFLYLNTNDFAVLMVADRSGRLLASTEASITNVSGSPALAEARSTGTPSNSDVIITEDGEAYVEVATPLRGSDGLIWGILVGRAEPGRIWRATLQASVDGSRNVVINNEGLLAAGVPDALVGEPWHGQPLANGSVRADVAGVDSICGLGAIGRGTQIDHGWTLASCLPVSLMQAEHGDATDRLGLITIAAAVLAMVGAAGLLRVVMRDPRPLLMLSAPPADSALVTAEALAPAAPPVPVSPVDVDAVALIEAYERRNSRLADHLREGVKARLLVATTQAEEGYRLASGDKELAARLHGDAMSELEYVRQQQLRAVGDELYPAVVRLGLPAALSGLAANLSDVIRVTVEADVLADAVAPSPGRTTLGQTHRLVFYRLALDGAREIASAGGGECLVALERTTTGVRLRVEAHDVQPIDGGALAASRIAVEALGGVFAALEHQGSVAILAELPVSQYGQAVEAAEEPAMEPDPPESINEDATAENLAPEDEELDEPAVPDAPAVDDTPVRVVKVTLREVLGEDDESAEAEDD
ncbi:MAG: cache domain-containing protein [Dehalococcoidia bacterium]